MTGEMTRKANELRLEGKSYKEISSIVPCSFDWCKRNLKGVGTRADKKCSMYRLLEKSSELLGYKSPVLSGIVRRHING